MNEPAFKGQCGTNCIEFVCPFCQRSCEAHIHDDVEEAALIHLEPTCQKFDELEIDDFMHQVNIQYGGHN